MPAGAPHGLARLILAGLVAALMGGGLAPAAGAGPSSATCSAPIVPGGEWRSYGQDLSGDRHQRAEDRIGPAEAAGLTRAWLFSAAQVAGVFESTPVVADGCVFVGSSAGWFFALAADDGKLVWKSKVPVRDDGSVEAGLVGATVVDGGLVFGIVSQSGAPYAVAVDEATGAVRWATVLDTQAGAFADATPVVYRGLVFAGFNADESNPVGRGGYVVLEAATGRVLAKRYVIPDEDYADRYSGASIWATAAVDVRTGYAFVGTGNPSTKREHERTNAILKIDLDQTRPTFGEIVDSYKGTSDSYVPRLQDNPACRSNRGPYGFIAATVECLHMDVDIGASSQLFEGRRGRLLVGALQKSGVYHAADTATMRAAWKAVVGAPCLTCNAATAATDGAAVYVEGVPPGQMTALDAGTGRRLWTTAIGDLIHFQAVTVAGGVVYTVDSLGNLDALDARTGRVVLRRPLWRDSGDVGAIGNYTSASLSVARHTIYVASNGDVIAYRPGAV